MPRFLLLVIALVAGCASTGARESGFLLRSVEVDGRSYLYTVYVPRDYDPARRWPVILSLHGAGERGEGGLHSSSIGLGWAIRREPHRWPAIAVFPQVPTGRQWAGDGETIALAALDATVEEFHVDSDRVYLTGLSMGGAGTWSLGSRHAARFAAVVPVCGWVVPMSGRPEFARDLAESGWDPADPYASAAAALAGVPVWIWHGSADTTVPVEESRRMHAALLERGAPVRYSELEGVGHNSWDPAYLGPELAEWLLAQRR